MFKDLKEAVKKQVQQVLVVLDAEPPGLQAEWSLARVKATKFLELMLQGLADDNPSERQGVTSRVKAFVEFFRGPWAGPMGQ